MTGSHRTERGQDAISAPLTVLLLAMVASVASSQRAAAQQNPTAAPKPAGSNRASRAAGGKRHRYGDWKKLCFKPAVQK